MSRLSTRKMRYSASGLRAGSASVLCPFVPNPKSGIDNFSPAAGAEAVTRIALDRVRGLHVSANERRRRPTQPPRHLGGYKDVGAGVVIRDFAPHPRPL